MSHLTLEQRYTIAQMKSQKYSQTAISIAIDKDKSVVSRELKRNKDERNGVYRSELAQKKCLDRHSSKRKKIRLTAIIKSLIVSQLKLHYSPEQIAGRAKYEKVGCVSVECIYQYIWADKKRGGGLYKHLRSKIKQRKKRGSKQDKRGQLCNKTSIDCRPSIVDEKQRFGDFEIDLVIGKNHQKALLTMNDRATGIAFVCLLSGKSSAEVYEKVLAQLRHKKGLLHTITSDNGKEFAKHQEIAKELGVKYYFAHPYSSWERGANENLNGLIREFFPKKYNFESITEEEIAQMVDNINNRPRKRFGYLTPNEVYLQKLQQ